MPASATATGPIPYTSYDGDQLSLYAWEGQRVALLTASTTYDEEVMALVLHGLDRAYDAYALITGREPTPYLTYDGLASIAEVPTALNGQAAAIGFIGLTGIEITPEFINAIARIPGTKKSMYEMSEPLTGSSVISTGLSP